MADRFCFLERGLGFLDIVEGSHLDESTEAVDPFLRKVVNVYCEWDTVNKGFNRSVVELKSTY